MQIYRIDHVSQAAADLDAQVGLLEGLFGFRRVRAWDNPAEGVRGARLEIPGGPGQAWEVVAPAGDGSALRAWPGRARRPSRAAPRRRRGAGPGRGPRRAGVARHQTGGGAGRRLDRGVAEPARARPRRPVPAARPRRPVHVRRLRRQRRGAGRGGRTVLQPTNGRAALDGPRSGSWRSTTSARRSPTGTSWPAVRDLAGFVQVWRTPEDAYPDMADLVLNIPGSSICWEVITAAWGGLVRRPVPGATVPGRTTSRSRWRTGTRRWRRASGTARRRSARGGRTDGAAWRTPSSTRSTPEACSSSCSGRNGPACGYAPTRSRRWTWTSPHRGSGTDPVRAATAGVRAAPPGCGRWRATPRATRPPCGRRWSSSAGRGSRSPRSRWGRGGFVELCLIFEELGYPGPEPAAAPWRAAACPSRGSGRGQKAGGSARSRRAAS